MVRLWGCEVNSYEWGQGPLAGPYVGLHGNKTLGRSLTSWINVSTWRMCSVVLQIMQLTRLRRLRTSFPLWLTISVLSLLIAHWDLPGVRSFVKIHAQIFSIYTAGPVLNRSSLTSTESFRTCVTLLDCGWTHCKTTAFTGHFSCRTCLEQD